MKRYGWICPSGVIALTEGNNSTFSLMVTSPSSRSNPSSVWRKVSFSMITYLVICPLKQRTLPFSCTLSSVGIFAEQWTFMVLLTRYSSSRRWTMGCSCEKSIFNKQERKRWSFHSTGRGEDRDCPLICEFRLMVGIGNHLHIEVTAIPFLTDCAVELDSMTSVGNEEEVVKIDHWSNLLWCLSIISFTMPKSHYYYYYYHFTHFTHHFLHSE